MKRRIIAFAIGLTALSGFSYCAFATLSGSVARAPSADREVDRLEIIRAYESARAAHFHHDAVAFLANNESSWYLVAGGTVGVRTTASEKPRVQEYFDSVKFADISDLDPPHVEVSSDGTMAWLLGHVRVRGTQRKANGSEVPLAFNAAWIDVWQKKAGVDGESSPERTLRRMMLHTTEGSALKDRYGCSPIQTGNSKAIPCTTFMRPALAILQSLVHRRPEDVARPKRPDTEANATRPGGTTAAYFFALKVR